MRRRDSRMLWVTPGPVLPDDDGNRQRLFHLIAASTNVHSVTLLTPPLHHGDAHRFETLGVDVIQVEPSRGRSGGRLAALRTGRPACLVPESVSTLEVAAGRLPGRFDLAFGPLAAAPAVLAATATRHGLDDQNHEADKYRLILRHERVLKRQVPRYLDWIEVARFERHWLRRADLVTVCSREDQRAIRALTDRARLELIPNGVDIERVKPADTIRPDRSSAPPRIVFVGGMSYAPNVDACTVLIRDVMPRVWDEVPEAEVCIVGKDPAPEVRSLAGPRVIVTGRVEDPVKYLHGAIATVVPLRAGGGTRLKVLEAMAAGTPVVATPIAVAGLGLKDGVEASIAESPDALAQRVVALVRDPSRRRALAESARARVERDYAWSEIGRRFCALL